MSRPDAHFRPTMTTHHSHLDKLFFLVRFILLLTTAMILLCCQRSASSLVLSRVSRQDTVRRLRTSTLHTVSSRSAILGSTIRMMATTGSKSDKAVNSTEAVPYIKAYSLQGVGEGSRVDILTSTGHTLSTDVPTSMGGEDTAPQPVETLLAAWMGCTQATAIFVSRQLQWKVENITTSTPTPEFEKSGRQRSPRPSRVVVQKLYFDNIRATRDERGALQLPIVDGEVPAIPSRIQSITGTIRVETKILPPQPQAVGSDYKDQSCILSLSESQLRILRDQTEARCPVANMIIASGCDVNVEWTNYHSGSV